MAKTMLKKSRETRNHVAERVEKGTLSSRGRKWEDKLSWEYMGDNEEAVSDFPKFDSPVEIEKKITYGPYQLEQAKKYSDQHLTKDGTYKIQLHKQAKDLLRVRVHSRHKTSKTYYTWIEYKKKVTGWCCSCKPGKRTVGCCAHVASVVWFLGYARHNNYKPPEERTMYDVFDADGDANSSDDDDFEEEEKKIEK
eukprot:Lithocolla_globosa_v1_NODE_5693_length_1200_cov_12.183406.p1 type:complete len:195 gc:universal NODE_5693_length_1200_cov_12.183406:739-155(-)